MTSKASSNSSSSTSTSAATLLEIVKSYDANDVLEFTAKRKAADDARDGVMLKGDNEKNEQSSRPSSVIVVDSSMTPLEAATLLWEHNM